MNLLSSETLLEYFNDYLIDADVLDYDFIAKRLSKHVKLHEDTMKRLKGKPISYPGFFKYLVLIKKFCPASLKSTRQRLKEDNDLLQLIKSVCEGDLVDSALLGVVNASTAQFILKNKHGYDPVGNNDDAGKLQGVTINIVRDE